MPQITIISVVYNAKDDLLDTINNVLSLPQKVDFIIIDGGSEDGSVDVIKSFESSLKHWVSEPDSGIYDAMNKGWLAADINSSILFLGAGDKVLSLPHTDCETQDVVYGDVALGDGLKFQSRVSFRTKLHNTLHHQALLIPKKLHPAPPFDTKYKVYGDFDFNQRLLMAGIRFNYAQDFIGYAMPDGVSSKVNILENIRIVNKNYGLGYALISALLCILSFTKSFFHGHYGKKE